MEFREAKPADLAAVVELTTTAYAPYTALLNGLPIPVTEDYAPRIARGEVWLLESDGEIAGLMVFERDADHVMIFSVAVSPAHQGKGFGIALLRWLEERTREMGLPEVRLYTNARMERNIALYLAYGFQETGRRPNPYRPGWILVDMAKRVDAAALA
ncbi:GNAT family N-acetyltransferase [Pseudaminobacter soli (ex Li et al. 2025)]|uniref:GNAT family N-acetyltransferase n=1 Tax=Pseudaminobacter soli (ex Li et al. 2025) TaxID=1295366 RepID=A0A2P7SBH7_9HYPH|nr:GNAT family N-acetyltransferase [Mesorhizobium soli]PSJ59872.1 GNAT family N-acetyltransferase [Mesorhizobium soli]